MEELINGMKPKDAAKVAINISMERRADQISGEMKDSGSVAFDWSNSVMNLAVGFATQSETFLCIILTAIEVTIT